MKVFKWILMISFLSINLSVFAGEEHGHKSEEHNKATVIETGQENKHEDEAGVVEITPVAQREANIKVTVLQPKTLAKFIHAPGEVIPNINLSTKVTPRVAAQVVKRYVSVGDNVKSGQALAILSSVEMAKAQSDLLLTYHEWLRVKELGTQAVGAKRYQTAQINYRHALAKLVAYGMAKEQADKFLSTLDSAEATGKFSLLSSQDGIIYSADVTEGEMVEPGHVLYHILDESSLWVDARLSNGDVQLIKIGASALIGRPGHWVKGTVIQIHHKLDETTRTQVVRINVPNKNDVFHPGQFVNCRIEIGKKEPVLAVPESAVLRTEDGDWAIYVETKPNHFKQVEIKLVETQDQIAIIKGVEPGLRVVTQGAFAVHSELLKAGFQVHNH